MRLPHTNSTISLNRRAITGGNKKAEVEYQAGIEAFISDTGTTGDHEQTYLIMFNRADVNDTVHPDMDTISDGTYSYKVMNVSKKTYHYEARCIRAIGT